MGIRGFNWSPSSPDLNPIEKVWHQMKHEITMMANPPRTIERLKVVLQELQDRVEPEKWRYLTERLTCKLEDVIEVKGMAMYIKLSILLRIIIHLSLRVVAF